MSPLKDTEDPPRVRYVTQVGAALVFVIFGLGSLGWQLKNSLEAAEAKKNLGIAPITVLHTETKKSKTREGRTRTTYLLQYKFTDIDGAPSFGSKQVSKRVYLAATNGDELNVEYDTQRPWNNYIEGTYQAGNRSAFAAFISLLIVGVGGFMWKLRPPLSLYTQAPKPRPIEHFKALIATALTLLPCGSIALGYALYRANRELYDVQLFVAILLGLLLVVLGTLAWRHREQPQPDQHAPGYRRAPRNMAEKPL